MADSPTVEAPSPMYNVPEKLRSVGTRSTASPTSTPPEALELTPKEKQIHDQGLVSVLRQLHADLDAAVFAAYGWATTLSKAMIHKKPINRTAAIKRCLKRIGRVEVELATAVRGDALFQVSLDGSRGWK